MKQLMALHPHSPVNLAPHWLSVQGSRTLIPNGYSEETPSPMKTRALPLAVDCIHTSTDASPLNMACRGQYVTDDRRAPQK